MANGEYNQRHSYGIQSLATSENQLAAMSKAELK